MFRVEVRSSSFKLINKDDEDHGSGGMSEIQIKDASGKLVQQRGKVINNSVVQQEDRLD